MPVIGKQALIAGGVVDTVHDASCSVYLLVHQQANFGHDADGQRAEKDTIL